MISLRGNAAIHYLPLSESGASDRSPMQAGHRKRMVFATGAEFSAERPTGAGLSLGMGLRDIGGEAGLMMRRGRALVERSGASRLERRDARAGLVVRERADSIIKIDEKRSPPAYTQVPRIEMRSQSR